MKQIIPSAEQRRKIFLLLFLCPLLCSSHPHEFIDVSAEFIVSNTGLEGFHIGWQFDDMNSAWMIDEYDKNKNGKFDKNEVTKIYKEGFSGAVKINYFASILMDGTSYKFKEIKNFKASIVNKNIVTYSFYAVCKINFKDISEQIITVYFEDPTVFTAFELKKKKIKISSNNRIDCHISYAEKKMGEKILLRILKKS